MDIPLSSERRKRPSFWRRHARTFLIAFGALVLVVVGWILTRPAPSVVFTDPGQPIRVGKGTTFAVDLKGAGPGCGWTHNVRTDQPVLFPVSVDPDPSTGDTRLMFRAVSDGSFVLRVSVAGNAATRSCQPVPALSFNVTVE